ncbi:CCHC-type domain-containing protein [Trichonephila clavipes]|nr:CCHC-type domain-containing protein [Trichonephila clavipes]
MRLFTLFAYCIIKDNGIYGVISSLLYRAPSVRINLIVCLIELCTSFELRDKFLVSLIRTIVREEVHRLVNQTQESLDSDPQSLEEIVQDEVERVLAPVSTKPTETRPRPTYAAVTRKYRAPVQKFPPEPRKTDVWRTADNRPVCFHCGRPGHVMRYCRERKAVFDNSRNRRRNFDDVGTEEEKYADQTLLAVLRQVPRGRSPIRRYRSPVAISPIQSVTRP